VRRGGFAALGKGDRGKGQPPRVAVRGRVWRARAWVEKKHGEDCVFTIGESATSQSQNWIEWSCF